MEVYRNKVAVITGAASGIGKCLGEQLAALGAHVELSDINPDGIENAVSEIQSSGGSASPTVRIVVPSYGAAASSRDQAMASVP